MGKLRVVAGTHGGRLIRVPARTAVRPTPQRVRESLFSALGDAVRGAVVADLYAGSGALGIEALSRGAEHVHFVDSDARTVRHLRDVIREFGLQDRSTLTRVTAREWLDHRAAAGELDIVLADPPFGSGHAVRLAMRFRESPFAGQLWIEHPASEQLYGTADRVRRYGTACISQLLR